MSDTSPGIARRSGRSRRAGIAAITTLIIFTAAFAISNPAHGAAGVPRIDAITPNWGWRAGGDVVDITGANFLGTTAVSFGPQRPAQYVEVLSDTHIQALPSESLVGTYEVTVTNAHGTSSTPDGRADYTYISPPPEVWWIYPRSGPTTGGTLMHAHGDFLEYITAVHAGGTPVPWFEIEDGNNVSFAMPALPAGPVQVTFTGPYGTNVPIEETRYTYEIQQPPSADAGPDQTVAKGAAITLDASGSSDPDDDPITYRWTQLSGPVAVITDPTQKYASVQPVGTDARLVFQVTVTDEDGLTHTDTVQVTVGNPK